MQTKHSKPISFEAYIKWRRGTLSEEERREIKFLLRQHARKLYYEIDLYTDAFRGPKFTSTQQVIKYFQQESLDTLFPVDQMILDGWAAAVLDHKWHCTPDFIMGNQ